HKKPLRFFDGLPIAVFHEVPIFQRGEPEVIQQSVSFKAQCIGQQFDIKLTESLVQQILLKGLLQIVVKIFQPPVDVFVDELQQLARSQRVVDRMLGDKLLNGFKDQLIQLFGSDPFGHFQVQLLHDFEDKIVIVLYLQSLDDMKNSIDNFLCAKGLFGSIALNDGSFHSGLFI